MMDAIQRAVRSSTGRGNRTVLLGGKSLGSARHWQPVLRMYITPLITSRIATRRLPPPGLPGGISGSISAFAVRLDNDGAPQEQIHHPRESQLFRFIRLIKSPDGH